MPARLNIGLVCVSGAFFNGVFLLALALSIFLQALERFIQIETVQNPFLVLIVGCVGLGTNILSALVIHGMSNVSQQKRFMNCNVEYQNMTMTTLMDMETHPQRNQLLNWRKMQPLMHKSLLKL